MCPWWKTTEVDFTVVPEVTFQLAAQDHTAQKAGGWRAVLDGHVFNMCLHLGSVETKT